MKYENSRKYVDIVGNTKVLCTNESNIIKYKRKGWNRLPLSSKRCTPENILDIRPNWLDIFILTLDSPRMALYSSEFADVFECQTRGITDLGHPKRNFMRTRIYEVLVGYHVINDYGHIVCNSVNDFHSTVYTLIKLPIYIICTHIFGRKYHPVRPFVRTVRVSWLQLKCT